MPDAIKRLGYVEKDTSDVLFVFERLWNYVDYSVDLVEWRMFIFETKLSVGIIFWLINTGLIRLNKIFSRILEKEGKRLKGRYEKGRSGGLPSFGIEIIMECFHHWGMWKRRRIELKIKVKRRMAFLGNCFINWFVIRSWPGNLLFDNLFIINWISLGEVYFMGKDIERQLVRAFSI